MIRSQTPTAPVVSAHTGGPRAVRARCSGTCSLPLAWRARVLVWSGDHGRGCLARLPPPLPRFLLLRRVVMGHPHLLRGRPSLLLATLGVLGCVARPLCVARRRAAIAIACSRASTFHVLTAHVGVVATRAVFCPVCVRVRDEDVSAQHEVHLLLCYFARKTTYDEQWSFGLR